jgi:putative transposase
VDVAAVRLFVMAVTSWWADQRQEAVAYLVEENRILRAQLRGRIRVTDEERRRLAVRGHRLGRRRLRQVATIVTPDTILRWQVGCTLTAAGDGLLRDHRVLICDRDRKWSREVRRLVGEAGIRVVQTPYRAPNANTYAERFVRSIKEECLNRVIPIGEHHFRRAVTEFVDHYHRERNHQGLENRLIEGVAARRRASRIRRRPRLGGVLNYYERVA